MPLQMGGLAWHLRVGPLVPACCNRLAGPDGRGPRAVVPATARTRRVGQGQAEPWLAFPLAAGPGWTQRTHLSGVPAMKKVFTTGQVAKICKVAPRTVSKWFDSGRLKGYRIPGSQDRRIPREYLIKFLKEHGMPLGDLEDEAMAKVLIVAQDQILIENLKRELP